MNIIKEFVLNYLVISKIILKIMFDPMNPTDIKFRISISDIIVSVVLFPVIAGIIIMGLTFFGLQTLLDKEIKFKR